MLKTSFVVPSPDRQKARIAPGAYGSLRLCDQGMAEWSNNGDPDDYPPGGYPARYAKPVASDRLAAFRRKRPRSCRAANQRDELAALHRCNHSITSSARARTVGGISRPSALAVLMLMTSRT
jgi:hypothetical protein